MRKLSVCLFLLCSLTMNAQWAWHPPLHSEFPVVQNQGWNEDGGNYCRLPERAKPEVRTAVWNLSGQSAGLSIRFKSNASQIRVRYQVRGGFSMPHMPSTGVSGVDLYRMNGNDSWQFCFGNYAFGDTVRYTFQSNRKERGNAPDQAYEYQLYLPLYNGVKWMEIGVPENDTFSFMPLPKEHPIVVYGTSIAQGACASRAGMAWANILQRHLNKPLVNLGFSGNGKLEKEVLSFITELESSLIILDCLPNLNEQTDQEVAQLVEDAVKQIRQKRQVPILLVEQAGYSTEQTDTVRYNSCTAVNKGSRMAYDKLRKEGIKQLFHITRQELDYSSDAWVDFVHPSDFGMQRQAAVVEKKVRKILGL
ncbi:MAG: SGNH/GDSL hydrolase family protein [Macellibacteroides fermentans]|uniref:SGNH/GDSL hydrolase family protein n=1 Tax=Macellibacteroides fermentans TaxID=879969 RepID=UPI003AD20E30